MNSMSSIHMARDSLVFPPILRNVFVFHCNRVGIYLKESC